MFSESTSSSDEAPPSRTPFNAVAAAAAAQRERRLSSKCGMMRAPASEEDVEAVGYDEGQTAAAGRLTGTKLQKKRGSVYIDKLVEATQKRKEEQERVKERRLVREMEGEEGVERFLTRGYKRELRRREEGEKKREREEKSWGRREGKEVARRVLFREDDTRDSGEGKGEVDERKESVNNGDEEEKKRGDGQEGDGGKRKRRRSRFDVVESVGARRGGSRGVKRGMRRNDERAIEEYRKRYFERMEGRLKEGSVLWGKGEMA